MSVPFLGASLLIGGYTDFESMFEATKRQVGRQAGRQVGDKYKQKSQEYSTGR